MDEREVTLALEGDLTIGEVRGQAALWQDALIGLGKVVVDARALGRVDTAGLQLLVSLRKSCATEQRSFEWREVPPALKEAGKRAGLEKDLGMDADAGA